MEAGSVLRSLSCFPKRRLRHLSQYSTSIKASSRLQGKGKENGNGNFRGGSSIYKGPKPKRDLIADWVLDNDDTVRQLPIIIGGFSLVAALLNRTLSGVAPVADASSAQSRTDILTLGLAVTNILAGLVWLSIQPKYVSPVAPQGVECRRISSDAPDYVVHELMWAWESLSVVTCCRSFVILYGTKCLLQIGIAAESSTKGGDAMVVDATKLMQGSFYQGVMKSGTQSYLANLSLYPGRSELPFLPSNTQAVILQPLGNKGIAILGGDTIRGFTTVDQGWITLIAEKLDASFSKYGNTNRAAVKG